MSPIFNVYQDPLRAEAYAKLEFHDTYYLAYRDIPALLNKYASGNKAVDFGCGTGRSTRFLKNLGFDTIGIDISPDMLKIAKQSDPPGDYRLIIDDNFAKLPEHSFDVVLSAFTFDNTPAEARKIHLFTGLKNLLHSGGIIINLVSTPEIYLNEWASFTTQDFPENKSAKCGDVVKIIVKGIGEERPVEDIVWPDIDYRRIYEIAGLQVVEMLKPLAEGMEPYRWISETKIAPWAIYILK